MTHRSAAGEVNIFELGFLRWIAAGLPGEPRRTPQALVDRGLVAIGEDDGLPMLTDAGLALELALREGPGPWE